MYRYLMHERWQWFFSTPNMFAAFLIVWLGLLLTVLLTIKHNTLKIILFVILICGQTVLTFTYSRGGFIAWTCCLLLVFTISHQKYSIILLALFYAFILFILPAGYLRVGSIINISEGSILHRLWLWSGGIGTIAQFPFGCPYPLGKYYELQYMPYFLNENYRNFLSDTLTLGGKYGLWALNIYWLINLTFINWLYSIWYKNKNTTAICLLGTLAGVIVSGLFSTFYFVREILLSYIILFIILLFFILQQIFSKKWYPAIRNYLFPLSFSLIITIGIFFLGKFINSRLLYNVKLDLRDGQCLFISTHSEAKVLYFFADNNLSSTNIFFPDVRKWAEKGIDIYLCKIDDGIDGLKKAKMKLSQYIDKSRKKIIVAAVGMAASNILIAATQSSTQSRINKILLYNCIAQSPWENLSAINYIKDIRVPLILLYNNDSQYDTQLLIDTAKCKNKIKSLYIPLKQQEEIADFIFKQIEGGN